MSRDMTTVGLTGFEPATPCFGIAEVESYRILPKTPVLQGKRSHIDTLRTAPLPSVSDGFGLKVMSK
jgi:hypothetical protein